MLIFLKTNLSYFLNLVVVSKMLRENTLLDKVKLCINYYLKIIKIKTLTSIVSNF